MMYVFLKLGGSLITDKSVPLSIKKEVVQNLSKEIAMLNQRGKARLVIGTGAGSFGHYMVKKVRYSQDQSDPKRITAVHQSVVNLNSIVVKALQEAGLPAVSLAPMSCMKEQGSLVTFNAKELQQISDSGATAVVFGDIIFSGKTSRIVSTEEVFDVIARTLKKDRKRIGFCIFATNVDGVLDANKNLIKTLHKNDRVHIHTAQDIDVTGGMKQKIEYGFKALEWATYVQVINGSIPGNLTKALTGQPVGTQLVR